MIIVASALAATPSAQAEETCASFLDGVEVHGEVCVKPDIYPYRLVCTTIYSSDMGADETTICPSSVETDDGQGTHQKHTVAFNPGMGCAFWYETDYRGDGFHQRDRYVCLNSEGVSGDSPGYHITGHLNGETDPTWVMEGCYIYYLDYEYENDGESHTNDEISGVCLD